MLPSLPDYERLIYTLPDWYDPRPHPDDLSLAGTFPHHKHAPPDIKHHRVLAPGIRFDYPNLPTLIEEIERDSLISVNR